MKNIVLISLLATVLCCIGCETGPMGVNPVSMDSTAIKESKSLYRAADVMVSGDSIRIITFNYEFDQIFGSDLRFDFSEFSTFSSPKVIVRFKGGMAKTIGTYTWEPSVVKLLNDVSITSGVLLQIEGTNYFPVSGQTVITQVDVDPVSGSVTRARGYFNGVVQAAVPNGFMGTFPAGYDISKPTLFGNKLTVHSGWFDARNHSKR
ncbi:MAG: hypothetical protein HQ472_02520 [Ignavibacteria bacterium]|nr:hypothetical protein [Ignavibacteria bacterium]